METLGDLIVKPLDTAIKADANDATQEPDQDSMAPDSDEESAKDYGKTAVDAKTNDE